MPILATAATIVGILYPYAIGEESDAPDGSKVMRCVAVFVGIYQASIVSSSSLPYLSLDNGGLNNEGGQESV